MMDHNKERSTNANPNSPLTAKPGFTDIDNVDEVNPNGASTVSSLFNIINTILGGGVLALPQAFALSGLAVGIFVTVMIGFLSGLTSNLIVATAKEAGGIRSYKDLAIATFGVVGSFVVDVCLIMYLFGAMTGYIVIIADLLTPYLAKLFDWEEVDEDSGGVVTIDYKWRVLVSVFMVFAVLLPISMFNKIDFLKYTSTLALVCVVYVVIAVSAISTQQLLDEFDSSSVVWGNLSIDSFSAAPVIIFAFTFHTSLFPIKNEMKEPSEIGIVVTLACILSGLLYITVGVFGYLTFLECVESNVLVNFDESIPITIAKSALIVVLCFSYPLMNFACRISVWNLLYPLPNERSCWDWFPRPVRKWKNRPENAQFSSSRFSGFAGGEGEELMYDGGIKIGEEEVDDEGYVPLRYEDFEWSLSNPNLIPYILITTTLSVLALLLSILVPDIQSIFGLVGATAGSIVVFIFPGLAAIKVFNQPWNTPRMLFSYFCVVFGVLVVIMGTFVSIYNWNKEFLAEGC